MCLAVSVGLVMCRRIYPLARNPRQPKSENGMCKYHMCILTYAPNFIRLPNPSFKHEYSPPLAPFGNFSVHGAKLYQSFPCAPQFMTPLLMGLDEETLKRLAQTVGCYVAVGGSAANPTTATTCAPRFLPPKVAMGVFHIVADAQSAYTSTLSCHSCCPLLSPRPWLPRPCLLLRRCRARPRLAILTSLQCWRSTLSITPC